MHIRLTLQRLEDDAPFHVPRSQLRMLAGARRHPAGRVPQRVLVAPHVLGDGAVPSDRHEDVEVGEEALDDVPAAVDALVRHPPHKQASDHDDVRAERDRLEHVRAGADARVEEHGELSALLCVADLWRAADLLECPDRGRCRLDLTTTCEA